MNQDTHESPTMRPQRFANFPVKEIKSKWHEALFLTSIYLSGWSIYYGRAAVEFVAPLIVGSFIGIFLLAALRHQLARRTARSARRQAQEPAPLSHSSSTDPNPPYAAELLLGFLCLEKQRDALLGDAAEAFSKKCQDGWSRQRATLYCYVFPIRDQLFPALCRLARKVPIFGKLIS